MKSVVLLVVSVLFSCSLFAGVGGEYIVSDSKCQAYASRELLDKIGELASQDPEASEKLMKVAYASGNLILIPQGQVVILVDREWTTGVGLIHLKGEFKEYWTYLAFLSEK
jgi:hypothetical protein